MEDLNNKKVLLIAAKFFGYEEEIRLRLVGLGASVDYFDQRPSNSFMAKALIRINKRFLSRTIRDYYKSMIDRTRKVSYDYVLFISPEVITKSAFLELKQVQPRACFIVYMWDSVKNKGANIQDILQFFDYRYSFDKSDCLSPEWNILYRPLFFLNDYAAIKDNVSKKYQLLFVGTIHSDRYKILAQLREMCRTQKLSYYYYMYFPSKLLFSMRSMLDTSLRRAGASEFKFHPLRKDEILDLMEKSNVVVDIQHPKQTGLTMRTIEVLGARRKLLTTNQDIVNYDFYDAQNIQLIDRNNVNVDLAFFHTPPARVDTVIYEKYSIDGWISDIFGAMKKEK